MRLTIDEYSKYFKMSKEMVQSKLKAKSLNYIIENGMTYIIVTKKSVDSQKHQEIQEAIAVQPSLKLKPTVATVLGLYQRENKQLKAKIIELEAKVDKLIADKEQMLRDECNKIEKLYSLKDTQLKEILELVNKKITLESQKNNIHSIEHNIQDTFEDIKIEEIENKNPQIIELGPYLKSLDLKSSQRKIIKKRFLNACNNDVRIIQQNGRIFLDFSRYDYSDLLTY